MSAALLSGFAWVIGCGESKKEEDAGAGAPVGTPGMGANKKEGIGLIKEPTRLHPGWVCVSHPNMKSFYPGPCPTCRTPLVRQGLWACVNHPHFSATEKGICPKCGEPLMLVEDIEKKVGKPIEEYSKEILARAGK